MLVRIEFEKRLKEEILAEIVLSCTARKQSGLPLPSEKVSLSNISRGFDVEIQNNFVFEDRSKTQYCVFHIVDKKTTFSKMAITTKRLIDCADRFLEQIWIYTNHLSLMVEYEFTKALFQKLLATRYIEVRELLMRPRNKHRNILEKALHDQICT